MSATIHTLPPAPLATDRLYDPRLLGRRVMHRDLGAEGRLSGDVRYDRNAVWFEVECNAGRFWWAEGSVIALGPIQLQVPCPRG